MPNRRFEMYQYRHILVRMRMGDSNRAIADSGIAGRNKVKAIKRIASKHGWLEPDSERSLRPNLQFCCRKWTSVRSINALFLQTHKYKMTIKGCFLEYF